MDATDLLARLVQIPSVNPMGQAVSGEQFFESRLTDFLASLFAEWGASYERHTVEPGRDNIVAAIPPGPAGAARPAIVLEAHQDTVPTTGMTIPPFAAQQRGGRLYGRGACDIKGGMAAMLTAFHRLATSPAPDQPAVLMACTVNEEYGFTGARALAERWLRGESSLLPRLPGGVVVAEPTELRVVVAHKGVVRWRCRATGRAAHSSQPHLGENAIFRMAAVLRSLEQYAAELAAAEAEPRLGRPTLSVGTIAGGVSVNTVPDSCVIEIDRRLLPAEEPETARQQVIEFVARQAGRDHCTHEPPTMSARGLADQSHTPLARRLLEVSQTFTGCAEPLGAPYGADAPAYADAGIPTVVCGPGSIAQAHTCDEWVELAQVEQAAELYFRLCRGGVD